MASFYLSLGSNVGERFLHLKTALEEIDRLTGTDLTKVSSVYETDPVGLVDQPSFLNIVAGGTTNLSAKDLLTAVLNIEQVLGRIRKERWGPRNIDIDILTYELEQINTEHLEIPHPRIKERLFVLIPFAEVAPEQLIATGNTYQTVSECLENLNDKSGVQKWMDINWATELGPFEN